MTLCPFSLRATYLSFVYSSLTVVVVVSVYLIFLDDIKNTIEKYYQVS